MPSPQITQPAVDSSPLSVKQPQAWMRARVRLAPNLLAQSRPWVRGVYEHTWAPMRDLERQLRCLPADLFGFLLECEGGYAVITPGASHYVPGAAVIRQRQVQNVAYIAVEDLAKDTEQPLHVIGHLVDHYLGCGGVLDGPWLSEGAGLKPAWQAAGERLVRLFPLGYGIDDVALASPRNYFAQSLAIYCRERQRLNTADPQIEKWFRSTVWQAAFWKS